MSFFELFEQLVGKVGSSVGEHETDMQSSPEPHADEPVFTQKESAAAQDAADTIKRIAELREKHLEEVGREKLEKEQDEAQKLNDQDDEDELEKSEKSDSQPLEHSGLSSADDGAGFVGDSASGSFNTTYADFGETAAALEPSFKSAELVSSIGEDNGASWGGFSGWLLPTVAVGGVVAGAVALASGSSSSGGGSSQTIADSTVVGTAIMGPVTGGLSVVVYDAQGNQIGSGEVDSAGEYRINVGPYSGQVLVQVVDTNAAAGNYIDEAVGTNADLTVDLRSVAVVSGSETVVNVTPLTELATRELGLTSTTQTNLASVSATDGAIRNANSAIAKLFLGDGTLSVETAAIAPVIDVNGNDTSATSNTYGKVLAALSGSDANDAIAGPGGMETTIAALSSGITDISAGGGTSWAIQAGEGRTVREIIESGLAQTSGAAHMSDIDDAFLDTTEIRTNEAPVSSALANQSGVIYQAFEYDVSGSFNDPDEGDKLSYTAEGLPEGIMIDSDTGVISGATATGGDTEVTVVATDQGGLFTSQTFVISVLEALVVAEIGTDVTHAKAGDTVQLTLALSEAVTVNIDGGSPSLVLNLNDVSIAATYSGQGAEDNELRFSFTAPAGDGNDLTIASINLNGAMVVAQSGDGWRTDIAGQKSRALVIDNTAPTLEITADVDAVLKGETAAITFTFSEAPSDFDDGDISVTGGVLSSVQVDGQDPSIYTATFTPAENADGTAAISVNSFADLAQNQNAAPASFGIAYDTSAPTITDFDVNLVTGVVKIEFSEAPVDLELADITVTGGQLSNLEANPSDSKIYTATFTEEPEFTGTITGSIASGTYLDTSGNEGEGGSSPALKVNLPTVNGYVNGAQLPALTLSGEASDGANIGFIVFEKGNPSNQSPASGSYSASVSGGGWSKSINMSSFGDGTYVIQATATDSNGHSVIGATREFIIDTSLNAPVISTVPGLIEETSFEDDTLTLSGTVDSDVDSVLVAWNDQDSGTTDPSKEATVDAGTWTVTFSKAELASMSDGAGVNFTVTATDRAGNTADRESADIILELKNVAPEADLGNTISTLTVLTESGAGTEILNLTDLTGSSDVAFTDADGDGSVNAQLTYTAALQNGEPLPAWLEVSSAGIVRVAAGQTAPSAEASLTITVTATDGGGLSDTRDIEIDLLSAPRVLSIAPVDADPVLAQGDALTFDLTMSENVTVNTGSGSPTITLDVNGETVTASYASQPSGATLRFTATTPVGNGSSVSIAAIALNGATVVGDTSSQAWATNVVGQTTSDILVDNTPPEISTTALNAEEGTVSIASLVGTDNYDTELEWSFVVGSGDTDNGLFNLGAADGVLTFKDSKDYETDAQTYTIRVQATDDADNSSEKEITINLTDVNEAPTETGASIATQSVIVNTPALTEILDLTDLTGDGSTTAFEDQDSGANGQLTYTATLQSGESLPAWLELTPAGVLQIAADATAPAAAASLTITVTAEDGGGLTAVRDVDLEIAAPPTLTSLVDDVTNLDVRSDLVLEASEEVNLTAEDGIYKITISNDGGLGYRGETNDNTQTIRIEVSGGSVFSVSTLNGDPANPSYTKVHSGLADVLSISGNAITLDPFFDLDLGNNYHVKVDDGLFVSATSGLPNVAIDDNTSINFSTVLPTKAADASPAQAVWFDAGVITDSAIWLNVDKVGDITGFPTDGGDVGDGAYVVTLKDWDVDGKSVEDAGHQNNFLSGVRGTGFNAIITDFGLDDLVYIDDQYNNDIINNPEWMTVEPTSGDARLGFPEGVANGQSHLLLDPDGTLDFSDAGAVDNPAANSPTEMLSYALNGIGTSPVISG